MEINKTPFDGILLVKPDVFTDERGYFFDGLAPCTMSWKDCGSSVDWSRLLLYEMRHYLSKSRSCWRFMAGFALAASILQVRQITNRIVSDQRPHDQRGDPAGRRHQSGFAPVSDRARGRLIRGRGIQVGRRQHRWSAESTKYQLRRRPRRIRP